MRSAKQIKASMNNFEIFRLRGVLACLSVLKFLNPADTRDKQLAMKFIKRLINNRKKKHES